MSIAELLPEVRSLSRQDKIKLIRLLAQEVEQDVVEIIPANQEYALWSPESSFSAGAAMLEVLEKNSFR